MQRLHDLFPDLHVGAHCLKDNRDRKLQRVPELSIALPDAWRGCKLLHFPAAARSTSHGWDGPSPMFNLILSFLETTAAIFPLFRVVV